MYLEYFKLKRHPFRITPDPTLFFSGGGRGEVLEALIYAITTGEGIVKVIGEVGSGKTMLCRLLEERLPQSIEVVYLANPSLTPHDILYAIAFELKLPVTVKTERLIVMQQLHSYFLRQHSANRNVVVFIEEAQGMPVETLEEIRLLSNLETHQHKLLQIVLFGQPELEKNLGKRTIRQLKERITHSFHLEPLTRTEVSEYMRFRLQAAGCGKSGVFGSGAERLIARASQGLIRRINILADKAMLAAYAGPDAGLQSNTTREMVHSRHARAAIRDSEFDLPFFHPSWLLCVIVLVLVSAAVTGWYRFDTAEMLPTLFVGNPTSSHNPYSESQIESSETKNNKPSAEVSPAAQTNPEKPTGIQEQEVNGPPSAAVAAPTPPAEHPVATLTSESEPSLSAPPLLLEKNHPQSEEDEKATSALSRRTGEKSCKRLMKMRQRATAQWLQKVHREDYTIQLMAADSGNDAAMEKFLQRISPVSLLNKVYVCPARRGGHDMWIVIFNEFQEASSARRALDILPKDLHRFQPFVRRLSELIQGSQPIEVHN